jgi:hypothetical protein
MIDHTAFFGDASYRFALTDDMIHELENVTAIGIGALYTRVVNSEFRISDIVQIIRLGLIGGGNAPTTAKRLVDAYAVNRPLDETLPLTLDILDARWLGTPAAPVVVPDEADHAAITETMKEAGL